MSLNRNLKENPLEFNEIDKLDKLIKDFFNLFNGLYKEKHKKMHDEISIIKRDMGSKSYIELIEALEKFKFNNISTINELYKNIRTEYTYCNNDFQDILPNELYYCNCMDKLSKLEDFSIKLENFIEEIETENIN